MNDVYITAVLPAHNEADDISLAIRSIRPYVSHIIVACDNCTDDTKDKAREAGADDIFNTSNNHHRKAGALNQALEKHVNWNVYNQYFLIMDADTVVVNPRRWFNKAKSLIYPNLPRLNRRGRELTPWQIVYLKYFHKRAYDYLFKHRAYDCVGSIFQAPRDLRHPNLLTEGQKLEWEGYASKVERNRKVFVLTGTCSLLSACVLQKVYRLHHYKYFYNDSSLTEDFFMTISLKECHARLISPTDCVCTTATKHTVKQLMDQRRRWYAGALQTINMTNFDEVTVPYWFQQARLFLSTFAFLLFILVSIYIYLTLNVKFTLFWSIIFIGYDIDQVAKVWKYSDWIDRLYSISMIGCLMYSFILQMSYLWALYTIVTNKKVYWNHKNQQED